MLPSILPQSLLRKSGNKSTFLISLEAVRESPVVIIHMVYHGYMCHSRSPEKPLKSNKF